MILELHLLQNFSPACLNRDDTNAPKDCEFGGFRRARVSSQCIKRSIRQYFREGKLLEDRFLSHRTKQLVGDVTRRLVAAGKPESRAQLAVEGALEALGFKVDDQKTQYLLFLGEQAIQRFAGVVAEHFSELQALAEAGNGAGDPKKTAKAKKKEAEAAAPAELREALECIFDGAKAADLALFGRMLADKPERNVDAACQVAHALSTNRVNMELDFYTAVDDLQAEDDSGAGMMGTIEFNSSCFYRYANLDVTQLLANLQNDKALTLKSVEAFIRATVCAIPSGKQTTMAAQNPPSLVLAVVRQAGCWSLANAFANPVSPREQRSLITLSIEALDGYWKKLTTAYGTKGLLATPVLVVDDAELKNLGPAVQTLDALVAAVKDKLAAAAGGPV